MSFPVKILLMAWNCIVTSCASYLLWSYAALGHKSVAWCLLSLRTRGGWGGRGSVSTCLTQCGTTGGGRGTVRSHSLTNANAGKKYDCDSQEWWGRDGWRRKGYRKKKTTAWDTAKSRKLKGKLCQTSFGGINWQHAKADIRGSGEGWYFLNAVGVQVQGLCYIWTQNSDITTSLQGYKQLHHPTMSRE